MLELAASASEFLVRHMPQTATERGAYFGYLPGDATPIHNANMLVCALLARLAHALGNETFAAAAASGLQYTLGHQRHDGILALRRGAAPEMGGWFPHGIRARWRAHLR